MPKIDKEKVSIIPPGFRELLEALAYAVLKNQPKDYLQFSIEFLVNEAKKKDLENIKKPDQTKVALREQPNVFMCCIPRGNGADVHADDSEISSVLDIEDPPKMNVGNFRRQGVAAESWDPEKETEVEKITYPKTEEQEKKLLEAVKGILLFRCLDEDDRVDVVKTMFERKVVPGENIITCGEPGDNFYIIESGTYDIYVKVDGEMKNVAQYVNKGSFGELALMYNTPRAATITAVTEGTLWAMSRDMFRSIVLTKAFKKRKLYENLLESVDLLKALSPYERMSLADALQTRIIEEGNPVFLQGDVGQEMFFIESGSVKVEMMPEGSDQTVELCRLSQSQYFGELALVTKNPRAASVYALERTRLAVLEVESFERILGPCQEVLSRKAEEYAERRHQLAII